MGLPNLSKKLVVKLSLGLCLSLAPVNAQAENLQIPDLNGNGNDIHDYARTMAAFKNFAPLLQADTPVPLGVSITTDGKLEVGSPRVDGKLQVEDFLATFQHYVSKAWYWQDHVWGLRRTLNAVTNCINQGSSCSQNPAQIKALDINMDSRLDPLDSLSVANALNCMKAIQQNESRGDWTFFRYRVTKEDLFAHCK